jgi:hypothetical protein
MLSESQQDQLLVSLFATAEAMGQTLTKAAALLMVQDLAGYTEPALVAALQACRQHGGRFSVDAILKRVLAADGRPEANEAWAIALRSFDEAESVLMTPEIQQAAVAAAPIFHARDKVGARMAFLAAYERLVTAARAEARPVSWSLSLGHDPQGRETAIREGARLGQLTGPVANLLLEQHAVAPVAADGQAIAGLITGNGVPPSPGLRARWQEVKKTIQDSKRRKEVQQRWDHRKRLRAERQRKEFLLKQVEQLQAAQAGHHA